MRVSLRWLRQLFPNDLTVEETARALTMAGLEVDETADLGLGSGKVIAARVLEVEKHPEADRLHLVKAEIGQAEPARIVCGATNLRVGMMVPCAIPGAVLPGGFKIKKSKIRGQASEGMLCSAKELGFGADHAGIMELPEETEPGTPFDAILDLNVTPDRSDCNSVLGVARDLAAVTGRRFENPAPPDFKTAAGLKIASHLSVEVAAPEACPRYSARYMRGATPAPSPLRMVRALESAGVRSINNIVDVTNFVMLEQGIPLHAFDADTLRGGKIIVRFAEPGEKLIAIDDREITLTAEDLVIADAERPVALAGVMGGRETQVTGSTRNIVLECAWFDPVRVRKSARRHGMNTESSYRFERGTDREHVPFSSARAMQLLAELTGGEASEDGIDVHQPLPAPRAMRLRFARLNRFLGVDIPPGKAAEILKNLGFTLRSENSEAIEVTPPSWRVDMEFEEDLIEEVARIFGYDNIPETLPGIRAPRWSAAVARRGTVARLRAHLASLGLTEAVNYSFISEASARRYGFDPDPQPHLLNPITEDQAVMRPTLLPRLVEAVALNLNQGAESVRLFETGKVFGPGCRAAEPEDEKQRLAFVLAGGAPDNWSVPARTMDFHDARGLIESICGELGAGEPELVAEESDARFHPGRCARISLRGRDIGVVGELHPELIRAEELRARAVCAELDLDALADMALGRSRRHEPVSKFPASDRDLALVVASGLPADSIRKSALKSGKPLVEDVRIVDVYQGKGVPEGSKSVAVRLRLRNPEATLTDEEIQKCVDAVLARLAADCDATLRS